MQHVMDGHLYPETMRNILKGQNLANPIVIKINGALFRIGCVHVMSDKIELSVQRFDSEEHNRLTESY